MRAPNVPSGRVRPLALRVWRNPLARGIDRAEAVLVWGLLVVWLLALPCVATIGSVEWAAADAQLAADRSSVVAVDAVLQGQPSPKLIGHDTVPVSATATVRWSGRDGKQVSGPIEVSPSARAGDHLTIWLDPTGQVVARPMSTTTLAVLAMLATLGSWLLLGLLSVGVWWLVRRRFDRHRWRAWAAEWETFRTGRSTS